MILSPLPFRRHNLSLSPSSGCPDTPAPGITEMTATEEPFFLSNPIFRFLSIFRFQNPIKQTTSMICRLRIGHTCTPARLYRWEIVQSPLCSCELEEGTADHIFFNWPLRTSYLYNVLPSDIPKPINLKTLLFLSSTNKKIPPFWNISVKLVKHV